MYGFKWVTTIPMIIFRLFYRYHIFQTYLPNIEYDAKSFKMGVLDPVIPITLPEILDLNKTEIVTDAIQFQFMSFESTSSSVPLEENNLFKSLRKP
ncbi:hypothetical protein AB3N59_20260 (plasmid) [Leptospira sp. WS92.C1]